MSDGRAVCEPDRILNEIDRTRDDLDRTFDALGERVSPKRLLESVQRLTERTVASSPAAVLVGALLAGVFVGRTVARRWSS